MEDADDAPMSWRALLLETKAIFRLADKAYAPFSCPASSECCQLSARQRQPWLWPSEWRLLEDFALREWGALPPARADGACPFLDDAGRRCRVYAERPLGCRTYFCNRVVGPKHEPRDTLNALSRRLEFINQRMQPDVKGPLELLTLHAQPSPGT